MPLRLERQSLIDQLGAALRASLASGQWPDLLPPERTLCAELQVGRNSLRAALRVLAREKLVEVVPGVGTRNTGGTRRPVRRGAAPLGLLSPLPLEQLRPRQVLWIHELREILSAEGRTLVLFHGARYFRASAPAALRRLVARERCGCWILVRGSAAAQAWFAREGIPCVIAGSCHAGIDLPFVDLDYRAMCRHAAVALLRGGHRRIAYLAAKPEAAGDVHSEAGFLEGVRDFRAQGAGGVIVRHDGTRRSIAGNLRRVLAGPGRPSALLVNQSYHYLTVVSVLARLGLRVPEEVSLVCRDDDRFLDFLEPEPARYVESPHLYARKLARIIRTLVKERPGRPSQVRILPGFVRGASMAARAG